MTFNETTVGEVVGLRRPTVVVVDHRGSGMVQLARRLEAFSVILVSSHGAFPEQSADVLVVPLSAGSMATLEWALASWTALGRPEMVLVAGDRSTDPLAQGLSAAGVRYVLGEEEAAPWLLEHVPALVAYTRAQRALLEATERLPRRACPAPLTPDEEPIGLFHAEQQFRTTYIQMLLARSSSRREAALKARIAYRTFCHILEKLGISSRKQRDPARKLSAG
jgi:hypothetical protein